MRLIIFLILMLLVDLYVYQPFSAVIRPLGRWPRITLMALYWAIPLISVVCLVLYEAGYAHWLPGKGGRSMFTALLFLVYICKLLVVPFVLLDDLRRGVQYAITWIGQPAPHLPGRSRFLSTLGLGIGLMPFVALLYGMWRNPYRYKIHRVKVPVRNLPPSLEGFRLVQISDIHSGSFTFPEPVENAIRMVNDLAPDLICFTGDLVNNRSEEMRPYIPMFSRLKARLGIYSVLGNHDYGDYMRWPSEEARRANFQEMLDTHEKLGWKLLRNSHDRIGPEATSLTVVGVENYSAHPRFPKYGNLAQALKGTEPDALKILLSHDPSHWEAEVTEKHPDIFLTLSGHTHGMQFGVEIPGWIKWSPIQYVYKQWAGLYNRGSQYLYVNRGLGFLGYPGRVGILPEITLLELTGADPEGAYLSSKES